MDENAWFDELDAELDFLAKPELHMAEHLAQIGIGQISSVSGVIRQLTNIVVGTDFVSGLDLLQGYWVVLPTSRISKLVNLVSAGGAIPTARLVQTNFSGFMSQLPKLAEIRLQIQGNSWCRGSLLLCEGPILMVRDYQAQAEAFFSTATIEELQVLAVDNFGEFSSREAN